MGCAAQPADPSSADESQLVSKTTAVDLVWRNAVTGANVVWLMQGPFYVAGRSVPDVNDPSWALQATGDLDGDGNDDLVWRNEKSGENRLWLMRDTTLLQNLTIDPVGDLHWRIAAAADVDGDGKADLIWRNRTTGQNAVWWMSGPTRARSTTFQPVGDANWDIRGAGDIDGNGSVDLIWRNASTGQNVAWYMNWGSTPAQVKGVTLDPVGDPAWSIETAADVNGDGKSDLIWRNYKTGEGAVWYMNGEKRVDSAPVNPVGDPNWHIVGTRHRTLTPVSPTTRVAAATNPTVQSLKIASWEVWPYNDDDRMTYVYRGLAAGGNEVVASSISIKPSALAAIGAAHDAKQPITGAMVRSAFSASDFALTAGGFLSVDQRQALYASLRESTALFAPASSARIAAVPHQSGIDPAGYTTCNDYRDGVTSACAFPTASAIIGIAAALLGFAALEVGTAGVATPLVASAAAGIVYAVSGATQNGVSCGIAQRDLRCCEGFPTSGRNDCTCAETTPGTPFRLTERGDRGDVRGVQCSTKPGGDYKVLMETDTVKTYYGSQGGWCAGHPGQSTLSADRGLAEVSLGSSWDEDPVITLGERSINEGTFCTLDGVAGTHIEDGSATGLSGGQTKTIDTGLYAIADSAYYGAMGGHGAMHAVSRVRCQGWESDASYQACKTNAYTFNGGASKDEGSQCTALDDCSIWHQ